MKIYVDETVAMAGRQNVAWILSPTGNEFIDELDDRIDQGVVI